MQHLLLFLGLRVLFVLNHLLPHLLRSPITDHVWKARVHPGLFKDISQHSVRAFARINFAQRTVSGSKLNALICECDISDSCMVALF